MVQTAVIAKLPVYGRIRPLLHGCTRVVLRLETARVRRCRSAGRDGNRTRVTAPVTRLHTVPGGSPSYKKSKNKATPQLQTGSATASILIQVYYK